MGRWMAGMALLWCAAAAMGQGRPEYDATPRLGVLIPKGPPEYGQWFGTGSGDAGALMDGREVRDGMVVFRTGTIGGVPVVLVVQPAPGEVLRALVATAMVHDFNVKALIYPGTSGGHLPQGQMGAGDVVLGAKNVNHGNYYLSPEGKMEAGEFSGTQKGVLQFGALYADPKLLGMLACSAKRVAGQTVLPGWVTPVRKDGHPQVFYYGVQGTSEVWSDNREYTEATMRLFGEIDEDGDWYSNMAGTVFGVPFVEVSVISNSIFAYPAAERGTPVGPKGEANSHVLAQRISNRIALDLIGREGKRILAGEWTEPMESPWPAGVWERPTEAGGLLGGCE